MRLLGQLFSELHFTIRTLTLDCEQRVILSFHRPNAQNSVTLRAMHPEATNDKIVNEARRNGSKDDHRRAVYCRRCRCPYMTCRFQMPMQQDATDEPE